MVCGPLDIFDRRRHLIWLNKLEVIGVERIYDRILQVWLNVRKVAALRYRHRLRGGMPLRGRSLCREDGIVLEPLQGVVFKISEIVIVGKVVLVFVVVHAIHSSEPLAEAIVFGLLLLFLEITRHGVANVN
jgi:hypothetical protein